MQERSAAAAVPVESLVPQPAAVSGPLPYAIRVSARSRRRAAFVVAACAIIVDAALI